MSSMKLFRQFACVVALSAVGILPALIVNNAKAANWYFDVNGSTAGSGVTNGGSYSWENNVWNNNNSAGSVATIAYADGNFPRFAAAADATGSYTVTANANHTTVGMILEDGAVGSTLTIKGTGTIGIDGGVLQGFIVRGSSNLRIENKINGTGGISFTTSGGSGSGSLFLYGNNSYAGGTSLGTSGGLNFNNNNSFGASTGAITWATTPVVLADPDATSALTIANAMVTRDASTLIITGPAVAPVTWSGAWTLPSTGTKTANVTIGNNSFTTVTTTISGAIGGSGSNFVVNGGAGTSATTGTLLLTGASTYTGTTTITSNVVAGSSTTLSLGNGGATGTLSNAAAAAITINANSVFAINRNNAVAQGTDFSSSAITGAGSLTQAGTGTTTLNANNTYSGGTKLNAGKLAFGSSSTATTGPIGTGGLTVGSAATAMLASGGSQTVKNAITLNSDTEFTGSNDLEMSGTVNLGSVNRTLNVTNTAITTLSGVISDTGGTGGITKAGNGILTLTGANTYGTAGVTSTFVTGGKLRVSNTTGSGTGPGNVSVTAGILGGTGTIAGSVSVSGTGHLSPGASINVLGIGGNLSMTGGAFDYEINSSVAPIVGADLNNVTGNLVLSSVALSASDLGSGMLAMGTKFTLINYGGSWNGGIFTGLPNNSASLVIGSNRFAIKYNDTTGGLNFGGGSVGSGSHFVTITAVPEASTFFVIGLGGIFAFAAVRMGKRLGISVLKV